MHRSLCGLFVGALLALIACGSSTTPTTPTPTIVTDTFSDTLGSNGAFTFQFTTAASGQVTATLTTVSPDRTIALGFSLGTWSAVTSTCQAVLSNDNAPQGSVLTATAQTAGTYCVRIFDVGKITAAAHQTFTVTVSHP